MGEERAYSKRRVIIFRGVMLIVLTVFAAATYLGIRPWLDTKDQQWVKCEVIEARAQNGLNSASPLHIYFKTTNCGPVTFSSGLNQENYELIGEHLEPGTYEFRMGQASRKYARDWPALEKFSSYLGAKATAFRPLD